MVSQAQRFVHLIAADAAGAHDPLVFRMRWDQPLRRLVHAFGSFKKIDAERLRSVKISTRGHDDLDLAAPPGVYGLVDFDQVTLSGLPGPARPAITVEDTQPSEDEVSELGGPSHGAAAGAGAEAALTVEHGHSQPSGGGRAAARPRPSGGPAEREVPAARAAGAHPPSPGRARRAGGGAAARSALALAAGQLEPPRSGRGLAHAKKRVASQQQQLVASPPPPPVRRRRTRGTASWECGCAAHLERHPRCQPSGGPLQPPLLHLGDRDYVSIGRSRSCDFVLNSSLTPQMVSRCHAVVHREDLIYFVTDQGSLNGVWLNGKCVRGTHSLADGDVVTFGIPTMQPEFDYVFEARPRAARQPDRPRPQ